MNRLTWVLVVAVLGSALLLVKTSYESRRLFAALERARADEQELEAEFRRLDAEARTQSTHLRVERVARERLKMRSAHPAVTVYVADPAASVPASAVASAPQAGAAR
jgi:cell division protein FtsL